MQADGRCRWRKDPCRGISLRPASLKWLSGPVRGNVAIPAREANGKPRGSADQARRRGKLARSDRPAKVGADRVQLPRPAPTRGTGQVAGSQGIMNAPIKRFNHDKWPTPPARMASTMPDNKAPMGHDGDTVHRHARSNRRPCANAQRFGPACGEFHGPSASGLPRRGRARVGRGMQQPRPAHPLQNGPTVSSLWNDP